MIIGFYVTGYTQSQTMKSLKEGVDTLFFQNEERALEISEQGLTIALSKQDTFYLSYFLDQSGELNRKLGNFEVATQQLNACLAVKKNWKNLKDLSITHNNLGKVHFDMGNHDRAFKSFLSAYELMERTENKLGMAFYLNNIAATFDNQRNYPKALEYYGRSLEIKKELGDSSAIAALYLNLGITYSKLNDYSEACRIIEKALLINRELRRNQQICGDLNALGFNYIKLKELLKAKKNLLEAYQLCSANKGVEAQTKVFVYENLGLLFLEMGDLDKALSFNEKGLNLAKKIGAKITLMDGYEIRSRIEEKLGNYSNALVYERLAGVYRDSMINESTINIMNEIEGKYEYHKNKQLIQEKQLLLAQANETNAEIRENRSKWIAIGIGSISLFIIYFIRYLYKKKGSQLIKAQNVLIKERNQNLQQLNKTISEKAEKLKLSSDTKQLILDEIFKSKRENELPDELLSLTQREMEVLSYLALGWSDQEISDQLFISKTTTKTHLRRMYSKLLVKGRAGAVNIAHSYGILGSLDVS